MTSVSRNAIAFTLAGVTSALVWTAQWPASFRHQGTTDAVGSVVLAPPPVWSPDLVQGLLAALAAAPDDPARLAAVRALQEIPLENIPAALAATEWVKDGQLTLTAQVLLIRWASLNPDAAARWASQNIQDYGPRRDAFQQIIQAWAWHDPAGLGSWALARELSDGLSARSDVPGSSDEPVLTPEILEQTSQALVKIQPRLAFSMAKKHYGNSPSDYDLAKSLDTVAQVREALLAFDHPDRMDPLHPSLEDGICSTVLSRWEELDPEDLEKSPYRQGFYQFGFVQMQSAVANWSAQPPDGMAATARRLMDGRAQDVRTISAAAIVGKWAPLDPTACRAWLENLPEASDSAVVLAFSSALAAHSPAASFDWLENQPAPVRQRGMVVAYDSWTRVNPGAQPDQSSWTDPQRQAWQDLEALRTAGRPGIGDGNLH
jgi:hypothetical protein